MDIATFFWTNDAFVTLRSNGNGAAELAGLIAQYGPPYKVQINKLASFKGDVFRVKVSENCYALPDNFLLIATD